MLTILFAIVIIAVLARMTYNAWRIRQVRKALRAAEILEQRFQDVARKQSSEWRK